MAKEQLHITSLKKGDKAPTFKGIDQDGKEVDSTTFKNKKIVLYFYPKDSTPGCTAQACSLKDNYTALLKQGYVVIGVSKDSVKSHKKFADAYNLPFPLLADENKEIISAFDVWGEKFFMGRYFDGIVRTTFVIADGKIEDVITKIDTKDHASQLL